MTPDNRTHTYIFLFESHSYKIVTGESSFSTKKDFNNASDWRNYLAVLRRSQITDARRITNDAVHSFFPRWCNILCRTTTADISICGVIFLTPNAYRTSQFIYLVKDWVSMVLFFHLFLFLFIKLVLISDQTLVYT